MSIRKAIEDAMKEALRAREKERLEALRLLKGALLHKEKETGQTITDEAAVAVLRTELRKRQQSAEAFREVGREDAATAAEAEIRVIETFLPQQMAEADVEAAVRAYLADHPDMNHAGKLTGAMKKELGDRVDGKLLNEVCRRVVAG